MFDRVEKGIYWDESWNPIRLKEGYGFGCAKVSPGCANCWAERYSQRFYKTPPYDGRKREFMLNEKVLTKPLRARKPRVYFVCDLMDLFHKDVPDEFISEVFRIAIKCWKHTFVFLTKRPQRMLAAPLFDTSDWSNIWLGVSVEDQKTADERVPLLLQVPAAVRVVSIEPMLGPVDFTKIPDDGKDDIYGVLQNDWVICGGETGPGARPMNPLWARDVKNQCVAAGMPFFFKSWGEYRYVDLMDELASNYAMMIQRHHINPAFCEFRRIGKKQAGRLLDGKEWNQVPEVG